VRGWLRGTPAETDAAWDAVTHAFGGMFCAGVVGAEDSGEAVRTFGELYPPARDGESECSCHCLSKLIPDASHYLVSTPHLHLCTENLTPFLSLLPSKGVSGLSALLAKPGVVLSWGFKTEGIDVVMPTPDSPGSWKGWWEGVVDLAPKRGERSFSINKLFQQRLPRAFPAASSSVIRVVRPRDERFRADSPPLRTVERWMDGRQRTVDEWDLAEVAGKDMSFWWDGEGHFEHRTFSLCLSSVADHSTLFRAPFGHHLARCRGPERGGRDPGGRHREQRRCGPPSRILGGVAVVGQGLDERDGRDRKRQGPA
jgi:phosphatidylinositol glycan class T